MRPVVFIQAGGLQGDASSRSGPAGHALRGLDEGQQVPAVALDAEVSSAKSPGCSAWA
jgi:hypothetical protein